MVLQNCAVTEIAPFTGQWNRQRVMHLYRRLGFAASEAEIQAGLLFPNASALVDHLLDTAVALPSPTAPYWADWTDDDYDSSSESRFDHYRAFENRWMREMITESIRAKMALFWHGHFVTEVEVYKCTAFLWRYYKLLHDNAFGNFRTFVEEMGKTPAMLVYLNGNVNEASEPNENYARELLELFTLGANNGYTSEDIVNISRALTGWKADDNDCTILDPLNPDPDERPIVPEDHDFEQKMIFGQAIPAITNPADQTSEAVEAEYIAVHDLIFTERRDEAALYICEQIYKHFVYPEVNPAITNAMAATFKDNNWEILPVLKQIFKSEHFFDETFIGGHIKSPMELFVGFVKGAELEYPADYGEDELNDWVEDCDSLGQLLFEPTNVAGWEGYRSWVNENTMTNRWSRINQLLFDIPDFAKSRLRNTIRLGVNDSSDPEVIVAFVVDLFINRALEPEHLAVAVQYLKAGIPENYFDDGTWNLNWNEAPDQIINLLGYLSRLPEFQMN